MRVSSVGHRLRRPDLGWLWSVVLVDSGWLWLVVAVEVVVMVVCGGSVGIEAINFSLGSSNPPWTICSHLDHTGNTPPRAAISQISCFQSGSLVQRASIRRCECYDMFIEAVPFAEAWSLQKSIVEDRKTLIDRNEDDSDTLIVLQHQPVYTLGTASIENNLNFDIKDPPFPLYQTEHGGEVTYHGPGQLVMYPIMNLRYQKMDLHWYLRSLEEVVIRVLHTTFSLKASRVEGLTGV